jgi:hypothetical protein
VLVLLIQGDRQVVVRLGGEDMLFPRGVAVDAERLAIKKVCLGIFAAEPGIFGQPDV